MRTNGTHTNRQLITCVDCGAQSDDSADFHHDGPNGPECTNAFITRERAWAEIAADPFWN